GLVGIAAQEQVERLAHVLRVALAGQDDPAQELNVGPVRFQPEPDLQVVGNGGASDVVGVVNVGALFSLFSLDADVLAAKASVKGFVGEVMKKLLVGDVPASLRPDGASPLEAVLQNLLPLEVAEQGSQPSHAQQRRSDQPTWIHAQP